MLKALSISVRFCLTTDEVTMKTSDIDKKKIVQQQKQSNQVSMHRLCRLKLINYYLFVYFFRCINPLPDDNILD